MLHIVILGFHSLKVAWRTSREFERPLVREQHQRLKWQRGVPPAHVASPTPTLTRLYIYILILGLTCEMLFKIRVAACTVSSPPSISSLTYMRCPKIHTGNEFSAGFPGVDWSSCGVTPLATDQVAGYPVPETRRWDLGPWPCSICIYSC